MPGYVTHYIFGRDIYDHLKDSLLKQNLYINRAVYSLGQQGPDHRDAEQPGEQQFAADPGVVLVGGPGQPGEAGREALAQLLAHVLADLGAVGGAQHAVDDLVAVRLLDRAHRADRAVEQVLGRTVQQFEHVAPDRLGDGL